MSKRVIWRRLGRPRLWAAAGYALAALIFLAGKGVPGAALQVRAYVGADHCASCHAGESLGDQHGRWVSTLHAKSLDALTGPNAFYAANAAGVKEPAKDPKCLRCHAPLFEKFPEFAREGVTCEICHGPGSGYAERSVMADRPSAVRNGLVDYRGSLNMILAYCLDCHDMPHGNPFEFSGAWEKIKHPRPNDPRPNK